MRNLIRSLSLVLALLLGAGTIQPQAVTIHGMNWNVDNNAANSDVRLKWSSPPARYPLTILYKYNPHPHSDYYAVFWYTASNEAFSGASYYNGGTPYPLGGSGTTHYWEVAHDGTDTYTDLVVKDVWYGQAFRSELDGSSNLNYSYYWNVTVGTGAAYLQTAQSSAANLSSCSCGSTTWSGGGYVLELGASPWTSGAGGDASANSETLYGLIRDIQIFDTVLTASEIATEMATESNSAITAVGQRHLWYSNVDPIPTDVTDKSGAGHNPSWANARRPAQFDSTFTSGAAFRKTLLGVGP